MRWRERALPSGGGGRTLPRDSRSLSLNAAERDLRIRSRGIRELLPRSEEMLP